MPLTGVFGSGEMSLFETVVALATLFVVIFFVVVAVVSIGISLVRYRHDYHQQEARKRVRGELFERQEQDDPEYEKWLSQLSSTEREQLESIVERYLRTVDGSQREQYEKLAAQLGMGKNADKTLDQRAVVPRLRSLALLSLLNYPISRKRLLDTCLDTRRTRQAAARLVWERRADFEHARITGTTILLFHRQQALTAYGLETLHKLNDGDPTPILIRANREATNWSPPLLVQICQVLEHCRTVVQPERFEWLFPLFNHDEPMVRAAAIGVFRRHGWRKEIRSEIPFRALVTDEDSRVRHRTYEVLAYWGDDQARQLLEWAVVDEEDSRCQLTAVRALASMDADPLTSSRAWPTASWNWVNAEIDADMTRRLPSTNGRQPVPSKPMVTS